MTWNPFDFDDLLSVSCASTTPPLVKKEIGLTNLFQDVKNWPSIKVNSAIIKEVTALHSDEYVQELEIFHRLVKVHLKNFDKEDLAYMTGHIYPAKIDLGDVILPMQMYRKLNYINVLDWVKKEVSRLGIYIGELRDLPLHILAGLFPCDEKGKNSFTLSLNLDYPVKFLVLQWTSDGSHYSCTHVQFDNVNTLLSLNDLIPEWSVTNQLERQSLNIVLLKIDKQELFFDRKDSMKSSNSESPFGAGFENRPKLLSNSFGRLEKFSEPLSQIDIRESAFIKLVYFPVQAEKSHLTSVHTLEQFIKSVQRSVAECIVEEEKALAYSRNLSVIEQINLFLERLDLKEFGRRETHINYCFMPFLDYTQLLDLRNGGDPTFHYIDHKMIMKLNDQQDEVPVDFRQNLQKKIPYHYPHILTFDVQEDEVNKNRFQFYEYHPKTNEYQVYVCKREHPVLIPEKKLDLVLARQELKKNLAITLSRNSKDDLEL